MNGLDVAVISEGDNQLICRGTIVNLSNDICLLEAYTKVYSYNRKVSLIVYGYQSYTMIYEGQITSIVGDTVLVEQVHLISRSERRRSRRHHTDLKSVAFVNGEDFTIHIEDVSEQGLLIASPQKLHVLDQISIQVPIIVDGEEMIFSGSGNVARNADVDKYGVHLSSIDRYNKKLLMNFIRRECLMLSSKVTMELTKKLMINGVTDTVAWIDSHTVADALMYLYDSKPLVIRNPGKYSTYDDNMRPAPEIVTWCEEHNVKISEFNFPVKIDPSAHDCSAMFAYCNSFDWPVMIPNNCEYVDYMFYKCLAYNNSIWFPKSIKTYKGALHMCNSLKEKVIIESNIETPGEMFRHAYRNFISDNRNEEEAIYQSQPVEVPDYINLVRSD